MKRYGNPNDNTLTFMYTDGYKLSLTPLMLNEWTRSMVCIHSLIGIIEHSTNQTNQYDGNSTAQQPPNSPAFDPTKKTQSILPGGRPSASSSGQSDLAAFASILQTVQNINNNGIQNINNGGTSSTISPSVASIPAPEPPLPMPILPTTPTSLKRFLSHCDTDLGIHDAPGYESPLRRKAYGPDILHKVGLEALESIGIPPGNAIRLRDASRPWFEGPLAKRSRRDSPPRETQPTPEETQPLVDYEKRWFDDAGNQSGSNRFTAPIMEPGDDYYQHEEGMKIFYKCTARNDWVEVPRGYLVDVAGDHNLLAEQ